MQQIRNSGRRSFVVINKCSGIVLFGRLQLIYLKCFQCSVWRRSINVRNSNSKYFVINHADYGAHRFTVTQENHNGWREIEILGRKLNFSTQYIFCRSWRDESIERILLSRTFLTTVVTGNIYECIK